MPVELTLVGKAVTRPAFWVTVVKYGNVAVILWLTWAMYNANQTLHKLESERAEANANRAPLGEEHDEKIANHKKHRQTLLVGFVLMLAMLFLMQVLNMQLYNKYGKAVAAADAYDAAPDIAEMKAKRDTRHRMRAHIAKQAFGRA